jgi:trans-aconitate methyltransferase
MTTWNAEDYSKNSSEQQKWARELIAKLKLRGDERVLDLGCGDGKVTAELAAHVPRGEVVGVDLSPEMIRFATEHFTGPAHANLCFAQADARALPFHEEFDVVFSNAVLHWTDDHRPVLQGIHRALRPGGRILLQMGGRGNVAGVLAVMNHIVRDPKWSPFFHEFSFRYGFHGPEEYSRWLTDAGLIPTRVELFPKDMVHDSPRGFKGWFRSTWMPWIDRVPADQRSAFIDDCVARYLHSHPADERGRVQVAMVRLEVEAQKTSAHML